LKVATNLKIQNHLLFIW